jgi:pyridoxamine 5'-phosphate oxidase
MDEIGELEPLAPFARWFSEAAASEADPEAMVLATAAADGRPSARAVLLKGFDDRGFVFYTNLESRKGGELAGNPHAALCFYWKSQHRQVRVEGRVEAVTAAEANAYFASRARESQIGAWASAQSRPLESRRLLDERVAEAASRFAAAEVPRPPFWSGFRVVPDRVEFWQERPSRLHDRWLFVCERGEWHRKRLYP